MSQINSPHTVPLQAVEVDPRRFCKDGQSWEVTADVASFPRLASEFTQGALFCRVSGRADTLGGLSLDVVIEGEVALTCQRCLGDMMQAIRIDRRVYIARTEVEQERLDALPDADAILIGDTLGLVELVEDEVLLDLPMAPMHAEGKCPGDGEE